MYWRHYHVFFLQMLRNPNTEIGFRSLLSFESTHFKYAGIIIFPFGYLPVPCVRLGGNTVSTECFKILTWKSDFEGLAGLENIHFKRASIVIIPSRYFVGRHACLGEAGGRQETPCHLSPEQRAANTVLVRW